MGTPSNTQRMERGTTPRHTSHRLMAESKVGTKVENPYVTTYGKTNGDNVGAGHLEVQDRRATRGVATTEPIRYKRAITER